MNTCLAVQHISIYCLQSYLYNCLLHFSFFIQFSRYTPAAGLSRSSAASLPTALSRSYRLASLWLFVTPLRGPSLFPVISLGSRHAAAPAAGGLNGGPVFFRKPQKATVGFNSLLPLSRHRSFLPDISPGFPPFGEVVGSSGLEPPTSRLSGVRSNHLSYEPIFRGRLWFAFPAYLFVLPALRSRPSAGNRCSQPFPFVRDMPRRQPLVEMNRIELSTPCLQGRCSPS